ncbi:hypothetical protein CWC46_12970 [Prodigiosinella confusarubida]|uniref:Uncharacterized protein n=1 Tax=Serratia sp. (strain ATCC 39006) TaxID=104623 RepID=A0A2I5TK71_SERS3|nr:hypothetical protein [Serratia sp. ATCC 39006]AUH00635.1 hypothetical protein CWC46_12970 [Serratia sp. ATCC 39006]AUH04956.1 hypothetical protein Ser39006_012975 [Serratia sp. ATCC 39006]
MTINYIKRYAENLNVKNDIANFNGLLFSLDGISAVSWELPGCSRREYGEQLLKDIYTATTGNNSDGIHVMVKLVPEQPDTAIVNYKKTWGLIEHSGVNLDNIFDKRSFIDNGVKGLVLTGFGYIFNTGGGEIQKLINVEEKLFFSNLSPDIDINNNSQADRLTQWLHNILLNDGTIFFLLGRFDEKDSEVVALGSKYALRKIM